MRANERSERPRGPLKTRLSETRNAPLVDIRISEKLGWEYPSLSDHWQQWCYDNNDYVKKYCFWKQQRTKKYQDKDIPVLDAVDVTFFVYLMREIDPGEYFE